MHEVLILIHGNKFLTNKIQIKLLIIINENAAPSEETRFSTRVSFSIARYLLLFIIIIII